MFVSGLNGDATVTMRAFATDPAGAEHLEHQLRLRAHRALRTAGIYS